MRYKKGSSDCRDEDFYDMSLNKFEQKTISYRRDVPGDWFAWQIGLLISGAVIFGTLIVVGLFWCKETFTEHFDILIINGSLIDGTGSPARQETIGIRDGKIAHVAWPYFAQAATTINADGLVVSPGFVDVHTHIEGNVRGNNTGNPILAPNFIAQGITTIITGNCGRSALSLSQFYDQLESRGIELNIGSLVGHSTIRSKVMGDSARAPSEDELKEMRQLVTRAMQDGALGLSTGLEYAPGAFADQKEIEALALIAAHYNGIYASHIRDEGNDVIKSIDEALEIARNAQIPLEISHLKWRGPVNWGKSQQLIDKISRARDSGLRVNCDIYPYNASSTTLDILVPLDAREGGRAKLQERLRSSDKRKRIVNEIISMMKTEGWKDFSFARVANCEFAPEYNGRSIPEITALLNNGVAAQENLQRQAEAICNLVSRGSVQMVYENMSETDVATIVQFDGCMMGSDSNIRNGEGVPHPRGYGSAPKLLSVFAIKQQIFSLEEAIRRMTSLPAGIFGLALRGKLLSGYCADVVIFDPASIKDKATYENPFEAPEGIAYVLVNGMIVLEHSQVRSLNSGQVIRAVNSNSEKRNTGDLR